MNQITIYGLYDPRFPDVIRYVGQTRNLEQRIVSHALTRKTDKRSLWIQAMRKDGVLPCAKVLAVVPESQANEAERSAIDSFPAGSLTNEGHSPFRRPNLSNVKQSALRSRINSIAKDSVIEALASNKWKIQPAAKALGIARPTLYDLISRLQITRPSP